MRRRNLLGLASLTGILQSHAAPVPWSCPLVHTHAYQVWINEVHYASAALLDRAVEVMTLAASGLNASAVSVVVVDGAGKTVGTRSLSNCLEHDHQAMPWLASVFVCTDTGDLNLGSLVTSGGGGLALVHSPTVPGGNPIVLQYLAVGKAAPYRGVEPCILPIDAAVLAAAVAGTSLQLVSLPSGQAATPDGAQWLYAPMGQAGWTEMFMSWGWEAGLPITFGTENSGLRAAPDTGDYVQLFRRATAVEAALVAPVVYDASGQPIKPSNITDCAVGDVTPWSACSLSCLPLSGNIDPQQGPQPVGSQLRWQPIVTLPNNGGAQCPPLYNRSETRPCAPTLACTSCGNLVKDGSESDVDCGGRVTDGDFTSLLPPGTQATIHDVVRVLFHDNTAVPQAQPPGACDRCQLGRKCSQHNDCSRAAGLVCAPGLDVCTPWQVLNATAFVRFQVEMRGVDPTSALSGSALANLLTVFAGLASGNGNVVSTTNLTIAGFNYRPGGQGDAVVPSASPQSRMLTAMETDTSARGKALRQYVAGHHPSRAGRARLLASETDYLVWTVLAAAPDAVQANVMAANVNARRAAGAAVAEEAVRPFSPLVQDTAVGEATVVSNPYGTAGGTTPANGEGGRRPVAATPAPTPADNGGGLSGGAIAGIVIGSIVAVGLVGAGAGAVYNKQKEAAEERRRAEAAAAARRTGRGINLRETAGQGDEVNVQDLTAAPSAEAPTKQGFAPKHAGRASEVPSPAPAASEAPAEALPGLAGDAAPEASALASVKPEAAPEAGGSPPGGSPQDPGQERDASPSSQQ